MIWVNEGRDQEARAILELAGIDSDKYLRQLSVHYIQKDSVLPRLQ